MAELRMPVLFAGHGSPMNAIEETVFGQSLKLLGSKLSRPRAILMISAHWQTAGTEVVSSASPKIIHDFGGFPEELFRFDYPAVGAPDVAVRIQELIPSVKLTQNWGLDHGAWSVLTHLFAAADIPVLQMSLDQRLSYTEHFELAKSLRPLRNEGILIIGSGNIIHNLRRLQQTQSAAEAPEWALHFDHQIATALEKRNFKALTSFETLWPAEAELAVPTPEHFLPLLYTAAASDPSDKLTFPITGHQLGTISMRTALWEGTC